VLLQPFAAFGSASMFIVHSCYNAIATSMFCLLAMLLSVHPFISVCCRLMVSVLIAIVLQTVQ